MLNPDTTANQKVRKNIDTTELAAAIGKHVQQLLANTGTGVNVNVEIQKDSDKSGKRQMDLGIHTGQQLLNEADVQLSFYI